MTRKKIASPYFALHFTYMNPRKNTSIRLSDSETEGLQKIAAGTHLKPATLIQKAIRKYIQLYQSQGPAILLEDPELSSIPVGKSSLGAVPDHIAQTIIEESARRAARKIARK